MTGFDFQASLRQIVIPHLRSALSCAGFRQIAGAKVSVIIFLRLLRWCSSQNVGKLALPDEN